MVKKLKTPSKNDDKQFASAVRSSAQQIWQAGLGAFVKAQEEGGRVFSTLVKEGTELQKRSQKRAEDKVSDVTGTVTKVADDVGKQASGSWDKLEQVFEERVSRALSSIGVPSQKDIQALIKQVEKLSMEVAELAGKKAPPAAKAAAAARKPGPKRAAKAEPAPAASAKAAPKAGVNFPTAASVSKAVPKKRGANAAAVATKPTPPL